MPQTTRIVIVSPYPVSIRGFEDILTKNLQFETTGWLWLDKEPSLPFPEAPDILVVDVISVEFLRAVITWAASHSWDARILAIMPNVGSNVVRQVLSLGVDSVLDKTADHGSLLKTVELLSSSRTFVISQSFWNSCIYPYTLSPVVTAGPHIPHLTQREQEILRLLDRGDSNAFIAEQLMISLHTVKRHVEHLLEKVKAKNRHELVRLAHSYGLIHVPRARSEGSQPHSDSTAQPFSRLA